MGRNKKQNDEQNVEQKIEINESYITQTILSSEISLKRYVDCRLKLFFDKLDDKIQNLVDIKYKSIHDHFAEPKAKLGNSLNKEIVHKVVESVINKTSVDENIKIYMQELSKLR